MHTMSYQELLQDRRWARPLVSSLIGRIPETMMSVALVLLVQQSTGSYLYAGLATGGFALGSALAGPVAGRALDRFGQRVVLIALGLTFAAVLGAIVVTVRHTAVALTIALASVAGLTRPPLESAMRAIWIRIATAGQLQAAYVLDAIGQDVIWLAGPLLLSGLLLIGGPRSALLACAACSALGTIAYVTTPDMARAERDADGPMPRRSLHSKALNMLLGMAALYGVAMGALEIALSAFCVEHGAKPAVGPLLAIWSIGSILGGLVYGTRAWDTPPSRRAAFLLGGLAILLALLTLADGVPGLVVLMFVMGLPTAAFTATLNAGTQDLAPLERASEGFSWVTAMITVGIAVGNATAGPLTQAHVRLGFPYAAAAAAAGAILGASATWACRTRLESR
jgi:MFS family permease